VSDASAFKVACQFLESDLGEKAFTFLLSEDERSSSSGERELLAMLKALRHIHNVKLFTLRNIIWVTDNENLVSFIKKGSSKRSIQLKVVEIISICHQLRCTLEPVHLLRKDDRIVQVDELSKQRDTDNWSVDPMCFKKLDDDFHFEIDVFADEFNTKTSKFISRFYTPEAFAVDAFSHDWEGMAWVCPPVSLLSRAAKRISSSQCQGIIVVPDWPASQFFNDFFESDYSVRQPFQFHYKCRPYIYQNENARNTALFGRITFDIYFLYFNTRR